jgi:hypothetical protein
MFDIDTENHLGGKSIFLIGFAFLFLIFLAVAAKFFNYDRLVLLACLAVDATFIVMLSRESALCHILGVKRFYDLPPIQRMHVFFSHIGLILFGFQAYALLARSGLPILVASSMILVIVTGITFFFYWKVSSALNKGHSFATTNNRSEVAITFVAYFFMVFILVILGISLKQNFNFP